MVSILLLVLVVNDVSEQWCDVEGLAKMPANSGKNLPTSGAPGLLRAY